MNLTATLIKSTPSPSSPDYSDAVFAVSGPGISGSLELIFDKTAATLNLSNTGISTDAFTPTVVVPVDVTEAEQEAEADAAALAQVQAKLASDQAAANETPE